MFDSIEKDGASIFRLTLRVSYILIALGINIGLLYLDYFPGTTKDEQFGSFAFGSLLLVASLIFSAPVFAYVFWKLVNHERSIFWEIAFLVGAFPILLVAARFFFDLATS